MTDTEARRIYDKIDGLSSQLSEYHAETVAIVTGCKICQQKLLDVDHLATKNTIRVGRVEQTLRTARLFFGWGLFVFVPLVAVAFGFWLERRR